MQYLHWGSETPEQRKIRLKIEEQVMFQQAIARKMFEQRSAPSANSAAFGAIAGPKVMGVPEFYLDNLDYVS